jgi:hypothetical protein
MEVIFDINARVYFCPICVKTFFVTDRQYKEAYERYCQAVDIIRKTAGDVGIFLYPDFVLNGHRAWIYRPDQNYSKELAEYKGGHKYAGICNIS